MVATGADWSEDRSVRAAVLIWLLTTPASDGRQLQPLRVAGVRIVGALALEDVSLLRPLVLHDCYIHEAVELDGARASRLDLSGCRLPSLSARRLETRGDLRLAKIIGAAQIDLAGGQIGGICSLRAAELRSPAGVVVDGEGLEVGLDVDLRGLDGHGRLVLGGAHIGGQLSLAGARLRALDGDALSADGAAIDGGISCHTDARGQRLVTDGGVRLNQARIGGPLNLNGAHLRNPNGQVLTVDRATIAGSVLCGTDRHGQRFEADGAVRLIGAQIGGSLRLNGARLCDPDGYALSADGAVISGGVFCDTDGHGQRFETEGEMRLPGARIVGQLVMQGAHLRNSHGETLNAYGATIDGGIFCDGSRLGHCFQSDGAILLAGAHLGGWATFADARLTNASGSVLSFERGRVGRLVLPDALTGDATVDLTDVAVSEFHDNPAPAVDTGYRARVTGFVYESLGPKSRDCGERLGWLERAVDGYAPGAYDQLASVYRRAGRDEDAKRVLVAKHVRRRQSLSRSRNIGLLLAGAPFGYGYRTWRAAVALAVIVLAGWPIFDLAYPAHMNATRDKGLPAFHGWLYSLDTVLPVINLGQESAWSPLGVAQAWQAFSIIAGWLLGIGIVAFLTARLFRE